MTQKKLFGDKAFYRRLIHIMIPILVQNVITTFVGLLDNVMVGRVGTEPMSGVAIVNQLLFVFNLCIFGGLAGAGIFTAQYFGKRDHEGVQNTFRFKWYIAATCVILFGAAFLTLGGRLISAFLHEGEQGLDLEATFTYARSYLRVMLFQVPIFAVNQVYVSTLRETGETRLPMVSGIVAVLVNLVFNYILIFGKFGAPALGVVGAAVATVISRIVELSIVILYTHCHPDRYPFFIGVYSSLRVPGSLIRQIAVLGFPLLANEVLWSSGMTMLNQCYSTRGLEVVSAVNIASTISNLFFTACIAMGSAVSIMIGQRLGAGETELAVEEDRKLIVFSVILCTIVGLVMVPLAPVIPNVYNTEPAVKTLASQMLIVSACLMPFNALTNAGYFTLRSGGKTIVTFLFDSCFVWVLCFPLAFILSRFTALPILPIYISVQGLELLKACTAVILVRSKVWVNNLVG